MLALAKSRLSATNASRLRTSRSSETLTSRLQNNDPSLTHLQLCRTPASLFGGGIDRFLAALRQNTVVHTVEFSWRFLSAISVAHRVRLMEGVGEMQSVEKFIIEAVGPCDVLVAALYKTKSIRILWIGALRLSSNHDVAKLEQALRRNETLRQINLYNIRLTVQGNHRLDPEGGVWFEETERTEKVDLNPLLKAIAQVSSVEKIMLDLQLNPDRMERIEEGVLRNSCRPPRTSLMFHACDLNDDDIQVVAAELDQNENCVEILNLSSGNRITERGWEALVKMMETNYNITQLFTPSNPGDLDRPPMQVNETLASRYTPPKSASPPSARCRAKMSLYVRLNQRGRKQLLCDSNGTTRGEWVNFLAQEIDDLDGVFYVLRVAPCLFCA